MIYIHQAEFEDMLEMVDQVPGVSIKPLYEQIDKKSDRSNVTEQDHLVAVQYEGPYPIWVAVLEARVDNLGKPVGVTRHSACTTVKVLLRGKYSKSGHNVALGTAILMLVLLAPVLRGVCHCILWFLPMSRKVQIVAARVADVLSAIAAADTFALAWVLVAVQLPSFFDHMHGATEVRYFFLLILC